MSDHKMCPILPTVNCYLLADVMDWNNICALIDFEFCLALRIIVPSKLQHVSYRALLFALACMLVLTASIGILSTDLIAT